VQVVDEFQIELFVETKYDLRVAVSLKATAARFEQLARFEEVVNFAVENDPDRAVVVGHRLVAAGAVDDAEPAHGDDGVGLGMNAALVGTAVDQHGVHAVDDVRIYRVMKVDDSTNAAHSGLSTPERCSTAARTRTRPDARVKSLIALVEGPVAKLG